MAVEPSISVMSKVTVPVGRPVSRVVAKNPPSVSFSYDWALAGAVKWVRAAG